MKTLTAFTVSVALAGIGAVAGPASPTVPASMAVPASMVGPVGTAGPARAEVVEPPLVGTYWVIEALVEGDTVTPVPADPERYLLVSDHWLEAYDGCNWITGAVEVGAEAMMLSGVGMTKRGCPDEDIMMEVTMFAAFHDGEVTHRIRDGRLELSRADGPGVLLRLPG